MILSTLITATVLFAFPHNSVVTQSARTPRDIAQFNGVEVQIDREMLRMVPMETEVLIPDFPLGIDRKVTLRLQPFDVFTPDAEVVIGSVNIVGDVLTKPLPRPDIIFLRGTIDGDSTSKVFLALGQHTTNGLLESQGNTYILAKDKTLGWTAVYNMSDVNPDDMNWLDFKCGVEDAAQSVLVKGKQRGNSRAVGCQALQIAVDTDWEFTSDLFGGDTAASSEYATTLIAAMSIIYQADVNVGMQVSFLRVWNNAADPWTANTTQAQLPEFREHWQTNMAAVPRHLAHLLSGRNLGGGIAYIGAVCTNFAYGVSANMNGSFPLPLVNNNQNNWDPFVLAHELGHNCGTQHTHDYAPPIDGCGLGDCTLAVGGTIMSYCHTCSGGMTNVVLQFHPIVQLTIENYFANSVSCSLSCDPNIPGACCTAGTCSELTEADCTVAGGVFLGTGTLCSFGGCDPVLPGACCVDATGTCAELDNDTCLAAGGTYLGVGTLCSSGWCDPAAAFACCITTTCSDLSASDCATAGGIFAGIGSSCAAGSCDPLVNDFCSTAQVVTTGVWDFTNIAALTDNVPYDSLLCETEFLGGLFSDIWFTYTACETSQLLVSTCDSVDFDSDIVVYEGDCANMVQVACNGDALGCAGFTSEVLVDVTAGQNYLIRVGGFSAASQGVGQIIIGGQNCQPDIPCIADVNTDGFVDVLDLLAIVDHWGEATLQFDVDESGTVGNGDILFILASWGVCDP